MNFPKLKNMLAKFHNILEALRRVKNVLSETSKNRYTAYNGKLDAISIQ
jgi:hypothetical protein